jgi:hypothetical protein
MVPGFEKLKAKVQKNTWIVPLKFYANCSITSINNKLKTTGVATAELSRILKRYT